MQNNEYQSIEQDYINKYGQNAIQLYKQNYLKSNYKENNVNSKDAIIKNSKSKSYRNIYHKSNNSHYHTHSNKSIRKLQPNLILSKNSKRHPIIKTNTNTIKLPLNLKNNHHFKIINAKNISQKLQIINPSTSLFKQSQFISPYKKNQSHKNSKKRFRQTNSKSSKKSRKSPQTKNQENNSSKIKKILYHSNQSTHPRNKNQLQYILQSLKQKLHQSRKNNFKKEQKNQQRNQKLYKSISPSRSSSQIVNILRDSIKCLSGIQQIMNISEKVPQAVDTLKQALNKVLKKTQYYHKKWKQTESQNNFYKKQMQLLLNRLQYKNKQVKLQMKVNKNHKYHIQINQPKYHNVNITQNDKLENVFSLQKQVETLKKEISMLKEQINALSSQLQYYKERQNAIFGMFNQFKKGSQEQQNNKQKYMTTSHFVNQQQKIDKFQKCGSIDCEKETRMKVANNKFMIDQKSLQQYNTNKIVSNSLEYNDFQEPFTIQNQRYHDSNQSFQNQSIIEQHN